VPPAPDRRSRPARILFVCVENSCRSQMAAGFARARAAGRAEVWSAGSRPAAAVHPAAVRLMAERGIDLSAGRPRGLAELPEVTWDCLVTMGCGDACPHLPARRRLDWELPDPKGMDDARFREVRDEIGRRVEALLADLDVRGPG
jgi:protein-tyrosine-phosphatase